MPWTALSPDAEGVLYYWFGELQQGFPKTARGKLWFGGSRKGGRIDNEIRQRFGDLHRRAAAGELAEWSHSPRGRLALLILLDQFSRNIHRGRAEAFAADALACTYARDGLRVGDDRQLAPIERVFCYLPFEHSEALADQELSVTKFEQLLAETDSAHRAQVADYLDYALEHRDQIRRFGRFPHRNAVLGRESSAEELQFLQDSSGFGQNPQASHAD